MNKHQIIIETNKCIGCGLCVKVCPAHTIKLELKKAKTLWGDCVMCGQCTAICPKATISISGYDTKPIEMQPKRLDPQKVLDVIRFRRSIRRFQKRAIPQEVIDQILEAGRLTHTAKNMQDVSFVVLDKEKATMSKRLSNSFAR